MRKTSIALICALIGALLAGIIGEILYAATRSSPPQARVLILLDVTSSMKPCKDGMVRGIHDFVEAFHKMHVDVHVGLLAFGDRTFGEEPVLLNFGGDPFTVDVAAFRKKLEAVAMMDGWDPPESSLDALVQGARISSHESAPCGMLLITDAAPKTPDKETLDVEEAVQALKSSHVPLLYMMLSDGHVADYASIHTAVPGEILSLDPVVAGTQSLESMLPEIGRHMAADMRRVQNARDGRQKAPPPIARITGCLAGILIMAILLPFINFQYRKRGRPVLGGGDIALGLVGGAIGGSILGLGAQWLFDVFGAGLTTPLPRILIWAPLGGIVGAGGALGVPKLQKWPLYLNRVFGTTPPSPGAPVVPVPAVGGSAASWRPALVVNGKTIALVAGADLNMADFMGPKAGLAPVALVIDNPKQPGVLGLSNRSTVTWTVQAAGASTLVEPGKTIRLKKDQMIYLGFAVVEVH